MDITTFKMPMRKLGPSQPVSLFESYLRQMVRFRAAERRMNCVICFLAKEPNAPGELPPAGPVGPTRPIVIHPPEQIAQIDRFVQFKFTTGLFVMDLPNSTMLPAEAQRLLECRPGFYRVRERHGELAKNDRDFDPVQRDYANADTRAAAEDMAFVLFDLWCFPLDWLFFFKRFTFLRRKRRYWEGYGTVE